MESFLMFLFVSNRHFPSTIQLHYILYEHYYMFIAIKCQCIAYVFGLLKYYIYSQAHGS